MTEYAYFEIGTANQVIAAMQAAKREHTTMKNKQPTPAGFLTYFSWSNVDWAELAYADKDRDRESIISAAMTPVCQCGFCIPHISDCGIHDSEDRQRCTCPTGSPTP